MLKLFSVKNFALLSDAFMLFFFIYDSSFMLFPGGVTTGRLVFLYVVFRKLLTRNVYYTKEVRGLVITLAILFIYSFFQYLFSWDFNQTSRIMWFFLYCIVFPHFIYKHMEFFGLDYFLKCVFLAIVIQSVIALFSFFSPAVKMFIVNFVEIGGNSIVETNYRAIAFASNTGSALSVVQFVGVCSGLLLMARNKLSVSNQIIIHTGLLIIIVSLIFIGRLGLMLSVVFYVIYSIFYFNFYRVFIFGSLLFIFNFVDFVSIFENKASNIEDFNVEFFYNWIGEITKIEDNHTLEVLQEMPIPPLTMETLIGTGYVFDAEYGVNVSGNDSGYIQTYYSLGLLATVIFYISYLVYLFGQVIDVEIRLRNFIIAIILALFLIENKEPYIFKYTFSFFMVTMLLFLNEDKNVQRNVN